MSNVNIVVVSTEGGYVSYSAVGLDKWERIEGEKALSWSFHKDTLRKIMGRMLTIVDASIGEPKQNKAIKDLVRQAISDEIEFGSEMAFDQDELRKSVPENIGDIKSVSLEEALGVEQ